MVESVEKFGAVSDALEGERRIFDRFSSRFPAKFKDTRNNFGENVYLRDASAGGIRITARERLYLNDSVTLKVELPDGKEALILRGEVVWIRDRDVGMWNVGVKFHKIVFMDMWRPYRLIEAGSAG